MIVTPFPGTHTVGVCTLNTAVLVPPFQAAEGVLLNLKSNDEGWMCSTWPVDLQRRLKK